MGLNLRKFWVLTWKTLIVKGRHYIETFLDLIVPTFLFMILAVLRYQGGDFLKPTNQPDEIFDTNQFLKKICDMRFDELNNATFYFAPSQCYHVIYLFISLGKQHLVSYTPTAAARGTTQQVVTC